MHRPRRTATARVAVFGLGLAIAGAAFIAPTALESADVAHDTHSVTIRSPGYDFGYASAAQAVCQDIDLAALAARTPKDPTGQIAADVAQGFADFSREFDATGTAGVCSAAARLVQIRQ